MYQIVNIHWKIICTECKKLKLVYIFFQKNVNVEFTTSCIFFETWVCWMYKILSILWENMYIEYIILKFFEILYTLKKQNGVNWLKI